MAKVSFVTLFYFLVLLFVWFGEACGKDCYPIKQDQYGKHGITIYSCHKQDMQCCGKRGIASFRCQNSCNGVPCSTNKHCGEGCCVNVAVRRSSKCGECPTPSTGTKPPSTQTLMLVGLGCAALVIAMVACCTVCYCCNREGQSPVVVVQAERPTGLAMNTFQSPAVIVGPTMAPPRTAANHGFRSEYAGQAAHQVMPNQYIMPPPQAAQGQAAHQVMPNQYIMPPPQTAQGQAAQGRAAQGKAAQGQAAHSRHVSVPNQLIGACAEVFGQELSKELSNVELDI